MHFVFSPIHGDTVGAIELINHNPLSALPVRHIYKAVERDRALSTAGVQAFLRGVRTSNVRRQFKLAFHLILATLVRKSELMLAQWKDFRFDSAEWDVPKETPQLVGAPSHCVESDARSSRSLACHAGERAFDK